MAVFGARALQPCPAYGASNEARRVVDGGSAIRTGHHHLARSPDKTDSTSGRSRGMPGAPSPRIQLVSGREPRGRAGLPRRRSYSSFSRASLRAVLCARCSASPTESLPRARIWSPSAPRSPPWPAVPRVTDVIQHRAALPPALVAAPVARAALPGRTAHVSRASSTTTASDHFEQRHGARSSGALARRPPRSSVRPLPPECSPRHFSAHSAVDIVLRAACRRPLCSSSRRPGRAFALPTLPTGRARIGPAQQRSGRLLLCQEPRGPRSTFRGEPPSPRPFREGPSRVLRHRGPDPCRDHRRFGAFRSLLTTTPRISPPGSVTASASRGALPPARSR